MSRQFDYRSTWPYPADEVYAAMVDPDYLRARLARIGGPGAALLEHHVDPDGVHYRLRHGLDPKDMPAMIRTVLPGDITIERDESWKQQGPGSYAATVAVTIHGTPASAAGGMRLHDTGSSSELLMRIDVTVKVPLIGSTVEGIVVNRVGELFDMEAEFTREWLAQRQ
jgi:hypothetical protein